MTILGPDGKPAPMPVVTVERCPRCKSEDSEVYNGFGGHWQQVCSNCGFALATGRQVRDVHGRLLGNEVNR